MTEEKEVMVKAYDLKILRNRLKEKGLDVAESVLIEAYDVLEGWYMESAVISKTPYDNMGLIILPQIKEIVKSNVDKLDGEVG